MRGPLWVDTHCHPATDKFAADAEAVLARAHDAGVAVLAAGVDAASSRAGLALARAHPWVAAAVGVHPCDIGGVTDADWADLCALAADPRVAAIGETGLDYYWKDTDPADQRAWFARHMELALDLGKPVSVHAREAVPDMLAQVEPFVARGLRVIWHCVSGSKKILPQAVADASAMGLYMGVGGMCTYEDQKSLRAVIPSIPGHLLLLETDAPYIIPRPRTLTRNEPISVLRVAEELAQLRAQPLEMVRAQTTANAQQALGAFWAQKQGEE